MNRTKHLDLPQTTAVSSFTFMLAIPVAALWLLLSPSTLSAQADDPPSPLPYRCVGVAPLDPDFCGCTWGSVYYRGKPILGTEVSITFQEATTSTLTAQRSGAEIIYSLSGAVLGAKRNDIMTLSTDFAGQTIARRFRARPNSEGEQNAALVIPEQGVWTTWLSEGYTQTLAIRGNTLWAGGPAGLAAIDLASDAVTVQPLPWPTQSVRALAVATDGTVWALNSTHLARKSGGSWENVAPPFGAMRVLAVDPSNGTLWVGGGNNSGALARYDGGWQMVNNIEKQVMALTFDKDGGLWAGTWGSGVYYHRSGDPLNSWTQFETDDGLASNYIHSAVTTPTSLWFGTQPALGTSGTQGGIARYLPETAQWSRYTTRNGLPADTLLPTATAAITTLAVDGNGGVWAGSDGRIFVFAGGEAWAQDGNLENGSIMALAASEGYVIAGVGNALHQLDRAVTPGAAPTVTLEVPTNRSISPLQDLVLTATAQDHDEADSGADEPQIINWEWRSDRDDALCTSAEQCTLTAELLGLGDHTITVRVQDDEGVWSAVDSIEVTVETVRTVYLPAIQNSGVTATK